MAGHGHDQVEFSGTLAEVLGEQGRKLWGEDSEISELQAFDGLVDGAGFDVQVRSDDVIELGLTSSAPTTYAANFRLSAPVTVWFCESSQSEAASVAHVGPKTAASQAFEGIEGVQSLGPDSVDQRVEHGNSRPRRLSVRLPSERLVTI